MPEGEKSTRKVGYLKTPLVGKGALGFHVLILIRVIGGVGRRPLLVVVADNVVLLQEPGDDRQGPELSL